MPKDEYMVLLDLLNSFDTAMLVTHQGGGRLHARPMVVADVDASGILWFLTDANTPKVDEIRSHDHVLVSFQQGNQKYVTVSGWAEVVRDPERVNRLWREAFQLWLPNRQQDNAPVDLIGVHGESAEYWDRRIGIRLARRIEDWSAFFSGAKAYHQTVREHGRIEL